RREQEEQEAREAAEREARELAEREEAERRAREEAERAAKEEAERQAKEAAEKEAREKAEKEAKELAEKQKAEEEKAQQKAASEKTKNLDDLDDDALFALAEADMDETALAELLGEDKTASEERPQTPKPASVPEPKIVNLIKEATKPPPSPEEKPKSVAPGGRRVTSATFSKAALFEKPKEESSP